uniref:Ricin B lectin domain-containing protein n=1 Tax=Otus sunia TaxID=257818 RepID=A0A8C8B8R6_9STRI
MTEEEGKASCLALLVGKRLWGLLPPPLWWQTMELFRLSLGCICLLPWLEAEGQGFLIRNTRLEKCIRVSHHETDRISLTDCKVQSQQQQWSWDPATRTIVSLQTKQCLSAHKAREYALVKMEPCGDWERQAWSCSKKGHLTLQSLSFHLSTKEGGYKLFVSREKGKFSRWKTLADETICAGARTAALRRRKPTQQAVETHVWIYESKMS